MGVPVKLVSLCMTDTYIERILRARVYDVAVESPLETAPRLSRRLGNTVLLKREDMQPVFSFKLRGAYNKIAYLSDSVANRGVICASAGNHALGGAGREALEIGKGIVETLTRGPGAAGAGHDDGLHRRP